MKIKISALVKSCVMDAWMLVHVKIRLLVSMEHIARLLAHCIASPKRTMLKENQTKKAAPHEATVQRAR